MSYRSQYTGEQFDDAIGFYLRMQSGYRQTLEVDVETDDWQDCEGADLNNGKYKLTVGIENVATFSYAPIVYFVDGNGLRWEVDCKYLNRTEPAQGSAHEDIDCFSNAKKDGKIVVATVVTTDTEAAPFLSLNGALPNSQPSNENQNE